jgi:hypothetical protein
MYSMKLPRLAISSALLSLAAAVFLCPNCTAQDSSGNQSWSATSQQGSPDGAVNPTRTSQTHTEADGRVVDKTAVQTLGPDGRYIPYSDTEKESRRINDTTVQTIERTFGTDPDGHRTLIQERQEESRSLPGGEQKVSRTVSNPDANGALQVVQREQEDSKQISPAVRVTNTTVLTPDGNGGFSPAVQTEQRETKNSDGTIALKTSTQLSDGTGGWKLSEVREGKSKQENGQVVSKEERILRPDSNGNLAVVERTVSKENQAAAGDKRETTETYSTNVPGVAGDDSLQLVQRQTTVHRTTSAGAQSTVRQTEQPRPGDVNNSFQVTEEAIDIVRPGSGKAASETHMILTPSSDGGLGQVWVDTGKTDNQAAIKVDTTPSSKPK